MFFITVFVEAGAFGHARIDCVSVELFLNTVGCFEKHNEPFNTKYLDELEDHGFNTAFILWGKQPVKSDELSDEEVKLLELYRQTREEMRGGFFTC